MEKLKWRIGSISKLLSPGWGSCYKCQTTWKFVEGHETYVLNGSGMFPLCEKCWEELTPETRLPYYEKLYASWCRSGITQILWRDIEKAVMDGR